MACPEADLNHQVATAAQYQKEAEEADILMDEHVFASTALPGPLQLRKGSSRACIRGLGDKSVPPLAMSQQTEIECSLGVRSLGLISQPRLSWPRVHNISWSFLLTQLACSMRFDTGA